MNKALHNLVRVATEDGPRHGVVVEEHVYRMEGDLFGEWSRGGLIGRLDELPLLAPVVPTKIVCVGRNYPAHAAEHGEAVPEEPLLFFKPPSAVIGPGAAIRLPPQSEQVDYEAELAVVIGRRCRDVQPEEAWDYVLGVTCGNDVTARDLQRRDDHWTRAKGFDTFCPLGPWMVTGLRGEDVADLKVACRVNGELRQAGRTSEMAFSPTELIAYTSAIMTLEPGDVIMTGTPEGVGPLTAGDVVEVAVQGIGVLRNPVWSAGSGGS
jgi:2-keto-4-pentenoate hydratase/2-oxohepta-3-ene-1,7-dioic acid hydratase in catechol pathway